MKNILSIFFATMCIGSSAQTLKDCATCSTNTISNDQIQNLSLDEIQFLTNDLFARKGYVFHDSNIDAYYSNTDWYKPAKSNESIQYNDIENQNIRLLLSKNKELKEQREKMVEELKKFKALLKANDKQQLKNQFSYNLDGADDLIKTIVDEVYIGDLHWLRNDGLYSITKDNGDIIKSYSLRVNGNKAIFEFGIKGISEVGQGKSIYPREYVTETTHAYLFDFKNGKLTFDKVVTAG
ncbi:MAG: YARHG domain-containing protein [Pseudopedobacter saltans]|uniref:YARHG domain-containing protein n=1 Tax=Pseudopedobacter saltans TaxID=151895 RepID=A0A2W5GZQ1_9SPHI|nr:MAG: YARHG domain-containing protein [Pseudopedobacter saltans]